MTTTNNALNAPTSSIGANNFIGNWTTTATAGGTTILTVSSTYNQEFTGTLAQTVQLPVTSTLVLGQPFYIINNSTGIVTVNSSGGNAVLTLPANSTGYVTCRLITGTTAASWYGDSTGMGTDLFPNGSIFVTNSTQTIVNGTIYDADGGGIVTFTMPGGSYGSFFGITGINGWILNIPSGVSVTIGNITISGPSNYWLSNNVNDSVWFKWVAVNAVQAVSLVGNPITNGGVYALPIAQLAVNNAFTAQNGITPAALTSSSNATPWDLNAAPNATYTAVENSVLGSASNQVAGNVYILKFVQHASSAKTFTFNGNFKFPQGVVPVVSTGLSAVDIYTFYSNGTNMYCVGISQNIS